jgi:pyruvate kinase
VKTPERQTKIIATIGPATASEDMLESLIREGVDVMRLNMAHATHDWIREITERIRRIGEKVKREPAILMDVKGPEIRTGYLQSPVQLKRGDLIDLVFTAQPEPPRIEKVWQVEVNYDKLHEHLKAGKQCSPRQWIDSLARGRNFTAENPLSRSSGCRA